MGDLTWPLPDAAPPAPGTQPRTLDQSCPKCGAIAVTLRYCPGRLDRRYILLACWDRKEHFHRRCERCLFEWITDDVLPDDQSAPS